MVESTAHRQSESVKRAGTDEKTPAVEVEVEVEVALALAVAVAVAMAMAAVASSGHCDPETGSTSVLQQQTEHPHERR